MSAVATPSPSAPMTPDALPLAGGVLLASHGGPSSEAAARIASFFAARRHVPIEALAVLELVPADLRAYTPDVGLDDERRRELTDAVQNLLLRASAPLEIPIVVEEGPPANRIARRAHAGGAALIALGIGQHEALDRLLGVETAIAVLRRTSAPVLAAAPLATAPLHTIIIATDFSPVAQRAARLALALAADDATVHMVHAWPWMDMGGSGAPVWRHVYQAGTQYLFDELIGELPMPPRAHIVRHLERGEASTVIRDLARQHHADLIALGSHGRGFIDRLTLGSVGEAVLRGADCSVLIAPPTEAEKES